MKGAKPLQKRTAILGTGTVWDELKAAVEAGSPAVCTILGPQAVASRTSQTLRWASMFLEIIKYEGKKKTGAPEV